MKNYSSLLIFLNVIFGLYLINEKGIEVPLLTGYKRSFYFLLVLGVVLCANSPLRKMFEDVWYKPFYLMGTILGLLILILVIGVILNVNIPYLNNYRSAYIILSVLVLTKSIVTLLHRTIFNG